MTCLRIHCYRFHFLHIYSSRVMAGVVRGDGQRITHILLKGWISVKISVNNDMYLISLYFSICSLPLYTFSSFYMHRNLCKPVFITKEVWVGYFCRIILSLSSDGLNIGALSYSSLYPQESFIHKIFMEHLLCARSYARYRR